MAVGAGYLPGCHGLCQRINGYRYALKRILADYLLGGIGTVMSAGLLAFAPSVSYISSYVVD